MFLLKIHLSIKELLQAMKPLGKIPQDKTIDNSLALLMEGYNFIPSRCRKYSSDIFMTRLLGEKVVCISGEEAARIFYDEDKFLRKGVAPKRIQKTLFGENAIQTMDGEPHKYRKLLFMSMMTPSHMKELSAIAAQEWENALLKWERDGKAVLFDASKEVLCKIACRWAGIPLKEQDAKVRGEDMAAMVDAFGAVGPRHWKGRKARKRSEEWIQDMIDLIRNQKLSVQRDTAAYMVAWHKEADGKLLDKRMAAIELLNVLRPVVAISTYIAYGALALHEYPESRKNLQSGKETDLLNFVQEVRRYYPFGPFLGARVKIDFTWNRNQFQKGELVLLDVYGTNRDPRLWENPDEFLPERFREWDGSLFSLIPQGGGNAYSGHRCPGETATIEIMKVSFDYLANKVDYAVPDQSLDYSLARIPTYPKSGFIMEKIRRK